MVGLTNLLNGIDDIPFGDEMEVTDDMKTSFRGWTLCACGQFWRRVLFILEEPKYQVANFQLADPKYRGVNSPPRGVNHQCKDFALLTIQGDGIMGRWPHGLMSAVGGRPKKRK